MINNISYTYDANGNRLSMSVAGTDSFEVSYLYGKNYELLKEEKVMNGDRANALLTIYAYDLNGNLINKSVTKDLESVLTKSTYAYDTFGKLTSLKEDDKEITYRLNSDGQRITKKANAFTTEFILDGMNVIGTIRNDGVTESYLRGLNLVSRRVEKKSNLSSLVREPESEPESESESESTANASYYVYNAHGDVVNLVSPDGDVLHTYDYDAFGVERNEDELDENPYRYSGEYFDKELGEYYLRARYYDPSLERFAAEDTYFGSANSIYGTNPRTIGKSQDALGLTHYTFAPDISAMWQSGNRYVYCTNSPVEFRDVSGNYRDYNYNPDGTISPCQTPLTGKDASGLIGLVCEIGRTIIKAIANNPGPYADNVAGAADKANGGGSSSGNNNKNNKKSGPKGQKNKGSTGSKGRPYEGTRNPQNDFLNGKGKSTLENHASRHSNLSPEEY